MVEISILLICFCIFDLFCPLLDPLNSVLLKLCLFCITINKNVLSVSLNIKYYYNFFSLTGGYFASCSQDRTAKMWCTDRIYPLRSFVGHTYDVDVSQFKTFVSLNSEE